MSLKDREGAAPAVFAIRNLFTLCYAGGFTSWHYRAGDTPLEALLAPGFFDPAQEMFSIGDEMVIGASWGGAIAFVAALQPHAVLTLPKGMQK